MNRQQYLDTISFKGDGEVNCSVVVYYPVWKQFETQMEKLTKQFPGISVSISKDETRKAGSTRMDKWGCLWSYAQDYLEGQVVEHPLKDWNNFKSYTPPAPEDYTDWKKVESDIREAKRKGKLTSGGAEHGFLFLKLADLRGFENSMVDIAEKNPRIVKLIDMITDYWMEVIKRYIAIGVDMIGFGDDLGLQKSLPISPPAWREFIKPPYKKIFSYCRANNVHVGLHTDGYILDIIPDLIECGVSVLNPQDVVNGIDNLERLAKGKVAINLDIDRQGLTVFGKKREIEGHILNCVKTLGSPEGGLSLIWGVYPGTPIENIEVVISSMDKYRLYWKKNS
ncbi:MAG: hypothetical protein JW957_02660 [Candidatus Omnitrophica bacterium]|nr:hypothetical protein [Candidatus Omnitrophota bacterium]